jgi:DNA-binding response OmpR family regulator
MDTLLLQQSTVWVLSQAGYRTCTADDGQSALRVARSEKPDLILLDVVLPHIDGFEVCCQLKADPALAGRFVVMLSGRRIDSLSQIEGLDGGADGYIARPFSNDELLARGLLHIKLAEDWLRESC